LTYNKAIQEIYIFSNGTILSKGQGCRTQFWKGSTQGLPQTTLV